MKVYIDLSTFYFQIQQNFYQIKISIWYEKSNSYSYDLFYMFSKYILFLLIYLTLEVSSKLNIYQYKCLIKYQRIIEIELDIYYICNVTFTADTVLWVHILHNLCLVSLRLLFASIAVNSYTIIDAGLLAGRRGTLDCK